jgi:hypothetical protein
MNMKLTGIQKKSTAAVYAISMPSAVLLSIAVLLKALYSVPFQDTFLWGLGVFLFFYIPGRLLVRLSGLHKDEYFIDVIHSLALGSAIVTVLYVFSRLVYLDDMILILGAGSFLIWLYLAVKDFRRGDIVFSTTGRDVASVSVLLLLALLALHFSFFSDVVLLDGGYKLRTSFNETLQHYAVVNVLKDTFPPFYPFASGHSFAHYHLNMHLQIEMFNRFFDIRTLVLTFYFFPLLYLFFLMFVPYMFVKKHLDSRFVGVITGLLMFGSGLSYLTSVVGLAPPGYLWSVIFHGSVFNFLVLNGFTPSAYVFFLCVLYMKEFYKSGKPLPLVIFSLLVYSSYGFKSTMGVQIVCVTLLTGITSLMISEEGKKGRGICYASLIVGILIALDIMILKGDTGRTFLIEPFNGLKRSMRILGLSDMSQVWYFLAFPLYVIATYGMRAVGFIFIKDIFDRNRFDPVVFFLICFSISGFIVTEFLFIESPNAFLNAAESFTSQSLIAGWLLIPYFLMKIKGRKSLYLFSVLIVVLAAPPTIQLYQSKAPRYYVVDKRDMEVIRFIEDTEPDTVVLHPANFKSPSLASNLAGRQSVYSGFFSFLGDWIGTPEQSQRIRDSVDFFSSSESINRASILARYGVDYVYATFRYLTVLDKEPLLSRAFENNRYVVYKVDGDSSDSSVRGNEEVE